MISPKSISEQLMFSTVRLEAANGSTGTGFFFQFSFGEKKVPVIITNKHVVNYNKNEKVTFLLHFTQESSLLPANIPVTLVTDWYFHEDQDLCFCFLGPVVNDIQQKVGKKVFLIPITEELIWNGSKLVALSAIEDVIMVGYPTGLWDEKNNLPLFRKGITSSHPAIDFNSKNMGAVDMACFPGSSGSPIFIMNEGGYSDKEGTFHLGKNRLIFLGVLFAGPQLSAKGELVIEDVPTHRAVSSITQLMINLGYYIKATEVLSFKKIVEEKLALQPSTA